MKTIFKQKLLVLFAALLALCLLAAGIGMLAAPHTAQAAGTQENTEVNALEQDSGYLWFKLTVQDYSGIASYQGGDDIETFCTRLNELNTLSMVEFDGAAMNTLLAYSGGFSKQANDPYINLFNKPSPGFSISLAGNEPATITIKAGCEFPSYAYASGSGDTVYVTTSDVTFRNEGGSWVTERETKTITDDVSLMIGEATTDDITYVSVNLLDGTIIPAGTHVNDHPTQFPVDLAEYILIGDKVENGQIAGERSARAIVTDNENGTTSYAGKTFPMSIGGVFSPIDIQTGGGNLAVWILKEYKGTGAFSITIKSGLTVTDGTYNYTVDEDIIYSFNADGVFTRFFEITWNVEGTETKQLVPADTLPEFSGSTDKESTVSTEYTFAGWALEEGGEVVTVPNATENATYYARYTEIPREYDITFMNGAQQIVVVPTAYGTAPVYNGAEPTRDPTDTKSYIFAGWSATDGGEVLETLPEVVGEATYYAIFTETERQYTVTFMNGDEQLAQEHVVYGSTPAYSGEAPTKAADAQYTYTFAGWSDTEDGEVIDLSSRTVKSDVTYYAVYTETLNEYTVTIAFTGIDGKEAQTLTLAYGTKIDFAQFAEEGYSFTVSDGQGTVDSFTVTGDAQLTVAYTEAAGPNTPEEPEAGLTPGVIAGIVIACVAVVAAAVAIGVIVRKKRG